MEKRHRDEVEDLHADETQRRHPDRRPDILSRVKRRGHDFHRDKPKKPHRVTDYTVSGLPDILSGKSASSEKERNKPIRAGEKPDRGRNAKEHDEPQAMVKEFVITILNPCGVSG